MDVQYQVQHNLYALDLKGSKVRHFTSAIKHEGADVHTYKYVQTILLEPKFLDA